VKALISIFLLILSITVAPILHARNAWTKFQADTYSVRGQRLLDAHRWQDAATAFAAAHQRSPQIASYTLLEKFALALKTAVRAPVLALVQPTNFPAKVRPLKQAIYEKTLLEGAYMLMAIVPASGTTQNLAKDDAGQYWGPVVRIDFEPAQTQSAASPTAPVLISNSAPQASATDAELAYVALADGDFTKARNLFVRAIAADPRPHWVADSRPLGKWLSIQSGITYREGASDIAASQALLGQGGGWLDAATRINGNPDRPLSLVGFLYSAQNLQHYGLNRDSLQAGFGIRWQPIKNITIEAARLQKIGNQARNDWMLRAGAGVGVWRPANLSQMHWLHWQARADAAMIGLSRRDIFAQADARIGLGFRLTEQMSITPYIGSTATVQKDNRTATLVEMSPGLWLHRSGTVPLDARLEYRRKMAGSAAASNGVALTLGINF
jgi:tetratricopeptide (TPR) repeat protein